MKLGIIAAMTIEAEQIVSQMTQKKEKTISGITYVCGILRGVETVVAVCGIGKVFAAMCAQTMCLHFAPEYIVNTGVGGTLTDKLSTGDLAISTAVVQHDMDTSPLGDPVGLISGLDLVEMPADTMLINKIEKICTEKDIRYCCGVIASGDQFIASREKKDWITSQFHGIACEMEGAAVGQVCTVNRVPFVILRAISDSADGEACMDYPTFAKKAAARSADVVMCLAEILASDAD